jgi:hypothetical protein
MLLLEGRHHRHHGFDEARPLWTLGANAAFAPEDAGPNRALRGVVRRLHALMAPARPQRLPQRICSALGIRKPNAPGSAAGAKPLPTSTCSTELQTAAGLPSAAACC